jgi:hypothetical protein
MSNTLQLATVKFSAWTAQNPTAARVIMLTVPFVAAAVAALVTKQPVFACPGPVGAGCGGG